MILRSVPEMSDEDFITFIGDGCAMRFLLEAISICKQKDGHLISLPTYFGVGGVT